MVAYVCRWNRNNPLISINLYLNLFKQNIVGNIMLPTVHTNKPDVDQPTSLNVVEQEGSGGFN